MRTALALVLALCLAWGSLVAQEVAGWWGSVVVASGFHRVSCDICRNGLDAGISGRAEGGWALSRNVLLGAQLQGWTDRSGEVRTTLLGIGPVIQWYPTPLTRPYFFVASLTMVRWRSADSEEAISASALGVTAGLGWDAPVAGRIAITPTVTVTATAFGELERDRTAIASAGFTLFQVGVGLSRR